LTPSASAAIASSSSFTCRTSSAAIRVPSIQPPVAATM
jgi:hypothetical protein